MTLMVLSSEAATARRPPRSRAVLIGEGQRRGEGRDSDNARSRMRESEGVMGEENQEWRA